MFERSNRPAESNGDEREPPIGRRDQSGLPIKTNRRSTRTGVAAGSVRLLKFAGIALGEFQPLFAGVLAAAAGVAPPDFFRAIFAPR